MNIEGGSLEFEALLNNEQLIGAISEAERRVKGFSSATVAESEKIDDAFEVTAENIKIQKDVIDQLEKEVVNLEQQIDKIGPGEGQAKIIAQAKSAKQELEAEKEALKVLESQVTRTYDTFDVTNENIRIQKEVIAELENQVKNLDAEIGKLAPGKAQSEMRQQAAEVKAELAAETEALKILESQVQTAESLCKNYFWKTSAPLKLTLFLYINSRVVYLDYIFKLQDKILFSAFHILSTIRTYIMILMARKPLVFF